MTAALKNWRWAILVLYCLLIFVGALHHEVWRDEVRALSIAIGKHGLSDLAAKLRNEGHPLLWYLVLKAGYSLYPNPVVLKIAGAIFGILSVGLFLFFAPFPWYLKLLWPFGFFPLYEYSISCRNYGIGMFLFFLYLTLRGRAPERYLILALVLTLLANTSIFGTVLALAILASEFGSLMFQRGRKLTDDIVPMVIGALVVLVGAAFALYVMTPDETSAVMTPERLSPAAIGGALIKALSSQGGVAMNGVFSPWSWLVSAIVASLYVLFWRKPSVIIFLFATVLGIELIDRLVLNVAAFRHAGILFVAIVGAAWLYELREKEITTERLGELERMRNRLLSFGLFVLFGIQAFEGIKQFAVDFREPMSGAAALTDTIKKRPELSSAIIMADRDYVLETLPYYLKNDLYFARLGRIDTAASFTSASKKALNLSELMEIGAKLKGERNVVILLPIGMLEEAKRLGRSEEKLLYGFSYAITRDEAELFLRDAKKLGEFRSLSDEHYEAFRLSDY